MDSEEGRAEASLEKSLAAHPEDFDFYQAVRRLENKAPTKARVGYAYHVDEDVVCFQQKARLAFSPASIASFHSSGDDFPPKMAVNFLGLTVPNGPMPLSFSEFVLDREIHEKDTTHNAFLNLFQNRIVALYYRSWAAAQITVNYERDKRGSFSKYVASLIGIGNDALLRRDAIEDDAKRFYAGWLACHAKNAEGLSSLLSAHFGLQTVIEEFVGQWVRIPEDCRCYLGRSRDTGTLGLNAVIGERFWDRQQKFRIRMGPMDLADYLSMLPSGGKLVQLVDWVRNYIGQELDWDACLALRRQETPRIQLGAMGHLGWSAWLRTEGRSFAQDRDDLRMDGVTLSSWAFYSRFASTRTAA